MHAPRCFLFLQGPLSPLYSRLAQQCEAEGHKAIRVNFCIGDRLHWPHGGAVSFRGLVAEWPGFAANLMRRNEVSDLILHGERRLYHRIAASIARQMGVRVIVTELGYLRPDWMTVELNGTGAASHFPHTPEAVRRIAAQCPPIDFAPLYRTEFLKVAAPDVIYNLANSLLWFLYPHYRRHTIHYPPVEYAAWLWRLAREVARRRAAFGQTRRLAALGGELFVFALQLEGDFQIRHRSQFRGLGEALEKTLASFAAFASPLSALAIKSHPLDNGLDGWRRALTALIARHGLQDRVALLDGGSLEALLAQAAGLVTVNSSAGIEGLRRGVPVKTLSPAIYDMAGLTHQGPLDSFWRAPQTPDAALAADFVKALAAGVQARGSIYSDAGLEAAVQSIGRRILDLTLNEPGAFNAPAPRLAELRALIRAAYRARRLKP